MIDTSIIESPRRDTSPQVYAGLPVLDVVRRTACAYMNQALRVSPAQAAAMEAGIQYGWSDPRANPANYTAAGDYCGQ